MRVMDETKRDAFLSDLLAESVKELLVYRAFVDFLCQKTEVTQDDLNSWLDTLRNDDAAIQQMRRDWQAHLARHRASSVESPRSILQEFVENWSPINPRQIN